MSKAANGSNGGNGKGSNGTNGKNARKLYLSERRNVVVQLRIQQRLTFKEISEELPSLGFAKVRKETCWDDYQTFLKRVGEAIDTTEQLGEILASQRAVFDLAIKAYTEAKYTNKYGVETPNAQAQAALLGEARAVLADMAKICGVLKPEQYEHKHSGNVSIIDEIARAERDVGKTKGFPGIRQVRG